MMRKGTRGRRRGVAIAAIILSLAVAAPELAAPAGAAVSRGTRRTELQTRAAARRTLTDAQKAQIAQYIKAHPQTLKNRKPIKRRVRATRRTVKHRLVRNGRKAKRKLSRKARIARRKRHARKVRAKRKANVRKRRARRGAVVAGRRARQAKNKKKAGSSGRSLVDWAALLFLIALPFIAVALLLFVTDYRRRPRVVSNKKRRRVLVITPVGRKY